MRIALTLACNQCGECCRHGGECVLRDRCWSLKDVSKEFTGVCEFLTENNLCSVMTNVIRQNGSLDEIRKYHRVVGTCDFPDLRKEST